MRTNVKGDMRLNGRPYHAAELKQMAGYVMQVRPFEASESTLTYVQAC